MECDMKTLVRNTSPRRFAAGFHWVVLGALVLFAGACASTQPQSGSDAQHADEAIVAEAMQMIEGGDLEAGLQHFEAALDKNPNSIILGNSYRSAIVRSIQEDRAIAFFKEIVEHRPVENGAYYNLAFAYIDKIPQVGPMGAGFLSKRSIMQFRKVLDTQPDDWIANYGVGMNYLHWPDYFRKNGSAAEFFEKCIELQKNLPQHPSHILPYIRLGDVYAKSEEPDKALAVWKEGLALFPDHKDLTDRLKLKENQVTQTVLALYNPNNSIGAIDTDISILWATEMVERACPLYANTTQDRLAMQGQLASSKGLTESELGLFAWFHKNLPFLSDKRFITFVDMSPLGIKQNNDEQADVNTIAYGMILGFMSEFQDESAAQIRASADTMSGFFRPFYHEGIGMGLAASLDTDAGTSFATFGPEMQALDPDYIKFHYVGAGVWFGLNASLKVDRVMRAFDELGPTGSAYAYEGLGFAQALFHSAANPALLKVGEKFPPLAAKSFYHGVGRAFWIMSGSDVARYLGMLDLLPAKYLADAQSGYGLGVSITRGANPAFVFSYLGDKAEEEFNKDAFLTGVVMGYTIRNAADPDYIDGVLAQANSKEGCFVRRVLAIGNEAMSVVTQSVGDLHSNWRDHIRQRLDTIDCETVVGSQ